MEKENMTVEERLEQQKEQFIQWHTREKARLIDMLKNHFGEEVLKVVTEQEGSNSVRRWADIAKRNGSNTIEDLVKLLWEPLKAKGLEYTMEYKDDGVQFCCTKCPYDEFAKENGITEAAFAFTCALDPYMVEGFNSKMGFKRTKTLMEGHDCCDHFYFMKE